MLAALLGLASGGAAAQEAAASSGPLTGEAPTGILLLGHLVLRPSVTLGAGYDSNIFYRDTGTRQSATLQLVPQVSLEPRGSRAITPRLAASLAYTEYLTDDDAVREQRSLSANVGANLTVVASEHLSLSADDRYARLVMPPYQPGQRQFTSNTNAVGVHAGIQPAGPRLKLDLSYQFTQAWYDAAASQSLASHHAHAISAGTTWLVLPRTSVGLTSGLGVVRHDGADKSGSYPVHVQATAFTAVTERLQIGARAGFGKGFYEKTRGPDDEATLFVLGFDLKYQTAAALFGLLYSRDFEDSLWANYYASDRVGVQARRAISLRNAVSANLSYDRRRFAPPPPELPGQTYQSNERTDHVISLQLSADHSFSSRTTGSLGYSLSANRSNFSVVLDAAGMRTVNDVSYLKHGVQASLRVAL